MSCMLGGVVDTSQFVRPFPRWYTPVKWFVPLGIAFVAALLTALMVTGVMPLPAIFSILDWLPAMYQGMESLGGFTLASLAVGTVATMSVMAASVLTRVFLFQYVENMATDNLNGGQYLAQFKEVIDSEKEKQMKARQLELEQALIKADEENQALTHEIASLRSGGQAVLNAYSSPKAKLTPSNDSVKADEHIATRKTAHAAPTRLSRLVK